MIYFPPATRKAWGTAGVQRQHRCSEPRGGFATRITLSKSFLTAFIALLATATRDICPFFPPPCLGPAPGVLSTARVRFDCNEANGRIKRDGVGAPGLVSAEKRCLGGAGLDFQL